MITAEQVAELSQPWIAGALERAAESLEAHAEKLLEQGDHSAEFPAGDAESIRSVIAALPAIATLSAEFATLREAKLKIAGLEADVEIMDDHIAALESELVTLRAANAKQANK